jgi:sensor histidine kinase YesM
MQALKAALAQAEAERLQQQTLHLETHLRLLQAQIEPHFLFNTLSNVASMIRNSPDQAEATLSNLTTLLRASLRRTRRPLVTLGDELDVVQSYLEIQRIRMGERLRYRINADDQLLSIPLPPLLVQPLVENAVRHGIEPLENGGVIEVRGFRDGRFLNIEVADTGTGLEGGDRSGNSELVAGSPGGTGISNVLARLSALYHGAATLTFSGREPHGVTAVITLPIEADAHSPAG